MKTIRFTNYILDHNSDQMKVIFTDFKRFNETHFWSSSRQNWLHQVINRIRDPSANPELDLLREPYSGRGMAYISDLSIFNILSEF